MVEGTPLLRAQTVLSRLEGSNPFLSARFPQPSNQAREFLSDAGASDPWYITLGQATLVSIDRLLRRGDTFYFRVVVPRDLLATFGRSEIKCSLRTTDRRLARLRCRALSNAFEKLFSEVRTVPQVTYEMVNERVKRYFQLALNDALELSQQLPSDPQVDLKAEVSFLRQRIETFRDDLARQSFGPTMIEGARHLLDQLTGDKDYDLALLQYACSGLLRAEIEKARVLAGQLSGRYEETAARDPLFTGMMANGLPPLTADGPVSGGEAPTLARVGDLYCAFKAQYDWVPKTASDTRRVLDLANEVIGAHTPIATLSTEDVRAVRDVLSRLPPNLGKRRTDAELSASNAAKANHSGPRLSVKTQDKYFGLFKSFLHWAADEGHIDKLPGAKIKVAGTGKAITNERRVPYSADQLQAIFASPLFTGHLSATSRHKKGTSLVRDGKYWTPLIALYSGMRMGEIVQLLSTDVKQEKAIWFFDISKSEGDAKQIKTKSSYRRVPVHRILIEAGFLDHVQKSDPKGRLFPDIEPGADGYFSHNFSKWWGRYSRQVGFKTANTAFHSFRHNFIDGLRNARVTEAVARALVGHSDGSVHGGYGAGPELKLLKHEVDKVDFGLSHAPKL